MDNTISDRNLYLREINDYSGFNFVLNEEDKNNWFDDIIKKLEIKENKFNSVGRYYYIEDIHYFTINTTSNHLWCSNEFIWLILKYEFEMNDINIKHFINYKMKEYFKVESVLPWRFNNSKAIVYG